MGLVRPGRDRRRIARARASSTCYRDLREAPMFCWRRAPRDSACPCTVPCLRPLRLCVAHSRLPCPLPLQRRAGGGLDIAACRAFVGRTAWRRWCGMLVRSVAAGGATVACCVTVAAAAAASSSSSPPPVEIGTIGWMTSLRAAKAESGRTGKPIFLQFTEIPG